MRILWAAVSNFASYKQLSVDFNKKGLTLIEGPTGSGKSTLCDLVPWILFGRTSKNGSVSEILRWGEEEPTRGEVLVVVNNVEYLVCRTRSKLSKDNDLWYSTVGPLTGSYKVRGKDLNDTQALINNLIGFDASLYLSGGYFHEFSQTTSFFTTTAKIRRQIVEQIVDLSMPKVITENASEYKKELNSDYAKVVNSLNVSNRDLEQLNSSLSRSKDKKDNWNNGHANQIESVKLKCNRFDIDKETSLEKLWVAYYMEKSQLESEIKILTDNIKPQSYFDIANDKISKRTQEIESMPNCEECGAPKNHTKKLILTKDTYGLKNQESRNDQDKILLTRKEQDLQKHLNEQGGALKRINEETYRVNPYHDQLHTLENEVNPHISAVLDTEETIVSLESDIMTLESNKKEYELEVSDVEYLLKINDDFRGVLIKSTIKYLEDSTNKLLTKHFDSEFRVQFDIVDADKLEVSVIKDGNYCVYSQLSKGQRQLLKLSFGVSIMSQVSNRHGINFNCIFLDEPTDGCDEALKVKAYGLLQELAQEYESVFVIEHSEALKAMFSKKFSVSLINGTSQIEEA